ncbi:DUF6571 family protein [Actinomyces sp. ZJ308]|uniref:DUF6571 family protein n=1 Tax=Actinomyces sp. ZJ308 TaxID=2708342 RepID=UPI001423F020|nr:DUF6571 family protein [Actinomyces sp. ZJ308]
MAFFKIDTEKATTQSNRLNEYGTFVATERSNIYKSSENNSHPVGTVEEAARAYGSAPGVSGGTPGAPASPDGSSTQPDALGGDGSPTTLAGCVSAIIGLAAELKARTTEVINLNQSGVNNLNADGTYSYYLPDPPEGTTDTAAYWASMDTSSNVRAYNTESAANGKRQAQELETAINSGDQAKVSQLLTEIDKHRDVPAYGATFYKQCGGPNEYLSLVHSAEQTLSTDPNAVLHVVNTLGHVLGGASQSAVGGDSLGKEFSAAIKGSPLGDKVAAFNALTSAPGSLYGTGFLVDAATILEDVDPNKLSAGTGLLSLEFTKDPMAGVLAAMGNNSKAALTYLSGTGSVDAEGNWVPDEKTQKRWDKLTSRDWKKYGVEDSGRSWCKTGQEGFTAALAAASSYRNADSTSSSRESDARATYVSANGIVYFAGDGTDGRYSWSKGDFTDAMQKNMAVVLGNSPEEVSGAASGGGFDNEDDGPSLGNVIIRNPKDPKNPLTMRPGHISTLIYRFGNNEDALTTLTARLGEYHHDHKEAAMNTPGAGGQTLHDAYARTSASMAYIESLANSRVSDDMIAAQQAQSADEKAVKARQAEVVGTSLSILSTIAAAGVTELTAGSGAPLALSLLTAAGQPIATDLMVDALGGVPDVGTGGSTNTSSGDGSTVNTYDELKAQGYADVANRGMFQQQPEKPGEKTTDQNAKAKHPDWYVKDENGNPVRIDPGSLSSKQIEKMMNWENEITNDDDRGVLNYVDGGVAEGETNGGGHARSAPPSTK